MGLILVDYWGSASKMESDRILLYDQVLNDSQEAQRLKLHRAQRSNIRVAKWFSNHEQCSQPHLMIIQVFNDTAAVRFSRPAFPAVCSLPDPSSCSCYW